MILSLLASLLLVLMGKLLPLHPRPSDELADDSLLVACARGDRAALGLLFDRFYQPVYRFLSRLLGPERPELDDLVQATFLEVLRAAPRFRGQAAVGTWILGVAANLARGHVRAEGRRRALLERAAMVPEAPAPPPDQTVEERQLLDRVAAALEDLPADLRTAFLLCDVEERPGVEVARALGVPAGTLGRRLFDARRRLRQALRGGKP